MATKLRIGKRRMKFKKKSSPLKLLSQSQPNFTEMIPPDTFWKKTIQNLVLIEQMVSDKKIVMGISHRVLC
jgi:hypothetical protein